MKSILRQFLAIVAFLVLAFPTIAGENRPRNIIFLIGDGMGFNQVDATEKAFGQSLVMTGLPVNGKARTSSGNNKVTDSAAAGTALATGVKTNNGMISVTPDGSVLPTLAEHAKKQGMRAGVISSVSIDHATPACFYAHVNSRYKYFEIAKSAAESNLDFLGGGGMTGQTKDGKDNLALAKEKGFTLARTRETMNALTPGSRAYVFTHQLASKAALPYAIDATDDDLTLAEITATGLRLLANDKGFFLMVEGGKIDWACHANDLGTTVYETRAFDAAVAEAVKFCKQHPDDTLVVITADHETGGLKTLAATGSPEALAGQTMGAEAFSRAIKELHKTNAAIDEIYALVKKAYGLTLTQDEKEKVAAANETMKKGEKGKKNLYGRNNPISGLCQKWLAERAGYQYTTGGHSAADVPVYAIGVGADVFAGDYENTDIANRIKALMPQ